MTDDERETERLVEIFRRFPLSLQTAVVAFLTRMAAITPPEAAHFQCPKCGRISFHPRDIEEGYCGACHQWVR